jgi:hypothetical protein
LDDGLAPGNDSDSDIVVISATVADDDAQSGATSRFLTINNAHPSLSLSSVPDITVNSSAMLTGAYNDAGLLDGQTLTVDWGDATAASTFLIPAILNAAGVATLNVGDTFNSTSDSAVLTITSIDSNTGQVGFSVGHQYTVSGAKVISASVADDDTGTDVKFATVSVSPTIL